MKNPLQKRTAELPAQPSVLTTSNQWTFGPSWNRRSEPVRGERPICRPSRQPIDTIYRWMLYIIYRQRYTMPTFKVCLFLRLCWKYTLNRISYAVIGVIGHPMHWASPRYRTSPPLIRFASILSDHPDSSTTPQILVPTRALLSRFPRQREKQINRFALRWDLNPRHSIYRCFRVTSWM